MLLLVVQAKDNPRADFRPIPPRRLTQQTEQRRINGSAITEHLGNRRPRQQAPLGTRPESSDGVVIRIEQIAEPRMKGPIRGIELSQHEVLKEPSGMGQ